MNNNASKNNKKRFNIADIIILVAALGIIILITQLFFKHNISAATEKQASITCTVRLQNVSTNYHGVINKGDTVYDDETGLELGMIVNEPVYSNAFEVDYRIISKNGSQSSETQPSDETGENNDASPPTPTPHEGQYTEYRYDDKENITLEIQVNATETNNKYFIGDSVLAAGKGFTLRVPGIIYEAEIINIKANSTDNGNTK